MLLTLSPCAFAAETWEPADESVQATASVAYNTSGVNFAGVATPRKNKAIVVIPGVLGSQLQNSSGQMVWNFIDRSMQLECNTNGTSKNTMVHISRWVPQTKAALPHGVIILNSHGLLLMEIQRQCMMLQQHSIAV